MFAMHGIVLPQCVLVPQRFSPCLLISSQAPTAIQKGFNVRVHRGPTPSFPATATAQFDVGYYAMPRAESQVRKRYPSLSSQNAPISFSASNASMKTPRSRLVDSTAANRGYESEALQTTPSYSIYQGSNDTYIYEASNSSKSDLYSHSEYDQSTTTFSPAMSTDSLTTLKSPATTDASLPDRSSRRPETPPTTSRGSFRSVLIPGLSQAQSALKGIFRAPASQDYQPSRTSTLSREHIATTRPSRASSPAANSQEMPLLISDAGAPSGTTPHIRLSTVLSPPTTVDATPSPTTPLLSPMYAPSTASELELLERDRVARANAEYNAASSTSPYFRQRRNSILVSAPVPPNRTGSGTNGRPHQLYPNLPLYSSPEQQHANVASPYTVESSHAAGSSAVEATTSSPQRRSPPIASSQHPRPGEPDDALSFHPDGPVQRRSGVQDNERRRLPEIPPPSIVPQLINEGPHHGRYVPASRTVSPPVSHPTASLRPSHPTVSQPPSVTEHDGYDSSMQRERTTSIRSQPRVDGSPPVALASSPRGPRDPPSFAYPPSENHPPRSYEHRWEEPRASVGEHQRDRSLKYVPRTSTIPNKMATTVAPRSSSPDRVSNASNLPAGGTRGRPSSRTAPEQTVEITPQYYTHRSPSNHVSPTASPSRLETAAVPGYHSSTLPRLHPSQRSYVSDQEIYAFRDLDRPRSPPQGDYTHVQDPTRHAPHGSDSLTSSEHHHRHHRPPRSIPLPHPPQQTATANHVHVRDGYHAHRQRRSRGSDESTDDGATPARSRLNSSTSESRSRPNYPTPTAPPPTLPIRSPAAGGISPEQRRQSSSDQPSPHSSHHTSAPPPDQSHTRSREDGRYPDGKASLPADREMGEAAHHSSFFTADADATTTTRPRPLIYPSDPLRPSTEPRRRHSDGDVTTDHRFPSATPHRRSSDGDRHLHLLHPSSTSSTPLNFLRTVRWTENLVCPSPISSSQRRKGWFNRRG